MLFPNQFVNARLLVDTRTNAIVVPSAAVQRGPASMYVYVVKSDNTVELRNVVPGPAEGGETAIDSGLEEDEVVVTDGLDKLQPGATVAPRDKSKNAEGTKKGSAADGVTPTDQKSNSTQPASQPSAEPGAAPATANKPAEASTSTTETDKEPKPKPSVSCDGTEADGDATSKESP
jgi:multidrug efflux system membrane fusion protein